MGLRDALIRISFRATCCCLWKTFASDSSLALPALCISGRLEPLYSTGSTPAKQADVSFFASRIQTRNAIRKLLLMNFLES